MNFLLPDDNQLLYGVSQGKQSNEENVMMETLNAHAAEHHAKLAGEGRAIITFKPPGCGAMHFNATGEVQVIGNSQAKKFAENLEKDKKKFLAENNFSIDKSIVGGPKGEQLTCSAHIDLILRSSAPKKNKRDMRAVGAQ